MQGTGKYNSYAQNQLPKEELVGTIGKCKYGRYLPSEPVVNGGTGRYGRHR